MLHHSVLSLIHNTPLLKLSRMSADLGRNIYLKLEGANPCGSIEDRIARSLIESAEGKGELKPGSLIIESSSASMAISLAMIARQRGYKLLCITDGGTSSVERGLLSAFGAEVITVTGRDQDEARSKRARKALAAAANGWWFDRYATPDLITQLSHRIGAEIVRDIESIPRWIVAPNRTMQLLAGLSEYFKSHWPDTRVMSVEQGEVTQTTEPARILLSPGLEVTPIEFPAVNARVGISEETALSTIRSVALQESLLLGPLSGLALAGVIEEIGRTLPGDDIVVLAPDLGWKHLDTIFGDTATRAAAEGAEYQDAPESGAARWS